MRPRGLSPARGDEVPNPESVGFEKGDGGGKAEVCPKLPKEAWREG